MRTASSLMLGPTSPLSQTLQVTESCQICVWDGKKKKPVQIPGPGCLLHEPHGRLPSHGGCAQCRTPPVCPLPTRQEAQHLWHASNFPSERVAPLQCFGVLRTDRPLCLGGPAPRDSQCQGRLGGKDIYVVTQGQGVPTWAVPAAGFPMCAGVMRSTCLKRSPKSVALEGFDSFYLGEQQTRAGRGGRRNEAFSVWTRQAHPRGETRGASLTAGRNWGCFSSYGRGRIQEVQGGWGRSSPAVITNYQAPAGAGEILEEACSVLAKGCRPQKSL